MKKASILVALFVFSIISANLYSQDTIFDFRLVSGKRTKKFHHEGFLHIERDFLKNGHLKTKSLTGTFMFLIHDTLFIHPISESEDTRHHSHRFYSVHHDSVVRVNKNEISRIVYDTRLGAIGVTGFWIGAVTGLVLSPIVSFKKGQFNTQKFLTITGVSLGGAGLCAGITLAFGEKKLELKPGLNKRLWKFK